MAIAAPFALMSGGRSGAGSGGGGSLALVEDKLVTADATSVTFSGLDGDTHDTYLLVMRWKCPANASTTLLNARLNAAADADHGAVELQNNGATLTPDAAASGEIAACGANVAREWCGTAWIYAKRTSSGVAYYRSWISSGVQLGAGADADEINGRKEIAGFWRNNADNLTSLMLEANLASAILEGSRFTLYRLQATPTSSTADAAAGEQQANATQSIPNTGAYTQLTNLATAVLTSADYTWTSNGFTFNRTGRYLAFLAVNLTAGNGNFRGLSLDHTDTTEAVLVERTRVQTAVPGGGANWFASASLVCTVTTIGDRLLAYVAHDAASGALNLNSGQPTRLSVVRLGDAP